MFQCKDSEQNKYKFKKKQIENGSKNVQKGKKNFLVNVCDEFLFRFLVCFLLSFLLFSQDLNLSYGSIANRDQSQWGKLINSAEGKEQRKYLFVSFVCWYSNMCVTLHNIRHSMNVLKKVFIDSEGCT